MSGDRLTVMQAAIPPGQQSLLPPASPRDLLLTAWQANPALHRRLTFRQALRDDLARPVLRAHARELARRAGRNG